MQISDFVMPTEHPMGMLSAYSEAYQKEGVLAFILGKCIESGGFVPVKTKYEHPAMVADGLLERTGDFEYKLTKKAIGLLYSHYAS